MTGAKGAARVSGAEPPNAKEIPIRSAAQQKLGFYPAPPPAIAEMLRHIERPTPDQSFTILDPCAGEGAALAQIADALGCEPGNVHAIELDAGRAQTIRATLPRARVLGPAFIQGCAVTPGSISLLWLNPPFDYAFAGGRLESEFLTRSMDWLAPGGLLCLVCPENVLQNDYSGPRRKLRENFQQFRVIPFPAECRPYNEVCIFAVKSKEPLPYYSAPSWQDAQADCDHVYTLPSRKPPRTWKKIEPTPEELAAALTSSPLNRYLAPPPPVVICPSPPMPPGTGHLALMLASGQIDGLVTPAGEPAHLVRGTARKKKYIASQDTTENEDGSATTRTVESERPEILIRTIDALGKLTTYSSEDEKTTEQEGAADNESADDTPAPPSIQPPARPPGERAPGTPPIELDLSPFYGSSEFFKHQLSGMIYTEGMQYVAETAGASWLIDLIASHQPAIQQRLRDLGTRDFQVWLLRVAPNKTATIECTEDLPSRWHTPLARQEIEYTDFPRDEFKIYCADGTIMLPSEY